MLTKEGHKMEFKDLKEISEYLKKDDDTIDDEPTVGELVDGFKGIGHNDHVYAFCDEVFLLDDIDDDLRNKKISEVKDEDSDAIDDFLEIASNMRKYNDREITDDILEEIREDKLSRGEDDDF